MLQKVFVAGLHPVLQEQNLFHQEQAVSGHHEQAPAEHCVQDFCMGLAKAWSLYVWSLGFN